MSVQLTFDSAEIEYNMRSTKYYQDRVQILDWKLVHRSTIHISIFPLIVFCVFSWINRYAICLFTFHCWSLKPLSQEWWEYDNSRLCHQMETFFASLVLCAGNSPVTGEFPSKRSVTRSFDVFFCAWINGWVNNRKAGDLGRLRAHYDVIVMFVLYILPLISVSCITPLTWFWLHSV